MKIKKYIKDFAIIFVLICGLLVLVSCKDEARLVNVEIITASNAPSDYTVGKFNYNDYSIKKEYSDGKIEEIPLSEDIISDVEKLKLWQVGEQSILIEYEGYTLSLNCKIKHATFDGVELVPLNVTYDGLPHEVQISGIIPPGTTIKINSGNSLFYTDAGNYTASVTLTKEGYVSKDLTAEVIINKAQYDVSTFKFEDVYYEYDAKPHAIEIKGELPQGVSVRYMMNNSSGNTAVNIGDYRVTAEFSYTNLKNYEPLDSITRTLHITKREVEIEEAEKDLNLKIEKSLLFYNNESKVGLIKEKIALPKEVDTENIEYVFYRLNSENDYEVVDDVIVAGKYKVRADLAVRLEYYNECNLSKNFFEVEFSIQKAEISTAKFVDQRSIYTGEPITMEFGGNVPSYYKHNIIYYIKPFGADDSEYVLGNSAINVGKYTVKVEFPLDENFLKIPSRTANLIIEKFYFDLTMPEDIDKEYDGEEYSLQEIVNEVFSNVGKNATVSGLGLNDKIIKPNNTEQEIDESNVELEVFIEMLDENGSRVEYTNGVGVYTIKGNYESNFYESIEKVTTYTIRPKITDFTRPKDATRIYYDGINHADFFNLEIPSYVVNGGVDFYSKTIYQTDQNGNIIKEVNEVKSAGYYYCTYHLNDDHNFIYEHDFEVKEFEIRRIEISSEFLAGLTFTTIVAKDGFIINEAINKIQSEYPMLEYGRDFSLEVLDNDFRIIEAISGDFSADYYIRITINDLTNYVAYDGVNEVNQLTEMFKIIDPKPIDDLKFLPDNTIYYTNDVTNVKNVVSVAVYNVLNSYSQLTVREIKYFNINDVETLEGALIAVGKYYAIVYFNDSLYYTMNGSYQNMQTRIDFEIRTKIIIETGDLNDESYRYNTADGYRTKDIIAFTDEAFAPYISKGLNIQSRKVYQINSDGSISAANTERPLASGDYYVQYSFTDNPDFVILGKSVNMIYNIPIYIKQLYELKSSDFEFSVTSRGADDDVFQDILNQLNSIIHSDRFAQLEIAKDNYGNDQFFMWYPSGQSFDGIGTLNEVGKFRAQIKFVGGENGIYYRRINDKQYTLVDLTFDFTIEVKSMNIVVGTQYFKATDENTNYYNDVYNLVKAAAESKIDLNTNAIKSITISKNGGTVTSMKSRDFGYFDYSVSYTDSKYYGNSTGQIVFAPVNRVYIDGVKHGNEAVYAEFIMSGTFNNGLRDPYFKGAAKQLSDYFSNEWRNKSIVREDLQWSISGYDISFKISNERLNEYMNWEYGFFTFSDTVKSALTGSNRYSLRLELKYGKEIYSEAGHGGWVKYNGEDINL